MSLLPDGMFGMSTAAAKHAPKRVCSISMGRRNIRGCTELGGKPKVSGETNSGAVGRKVAVSQEQGEILPPLPMITNK